MMFSIQALGHSAESVILLGVICFAVIVLLVLIGVQTGIAIGLAGVIGFYAVTGNANVIPIVAFDYTNDFILTSLPLFILMGEIMLRSGISDNLFRGTSKMLAWMPGGLLHAGIGSCALFATICGSSPATAATVGTVAIPALEKRGYDTKLSLGSLAAAGSLGILIPPSVNLIVYGAITQTSVARLFAAGVVPGVMLTLMFMAYVLIKVLLNPTIAPKEAFSLRSLPQSVIDVSPIIVILAVVLGGIFGGVFTPTEAAAIGVTAAIAVGLLQKKMSWQILTKAGRETVLVTSMVLIIVVGAAAVASFLAFLGLPRELAAFVLKLNLSGWAMLALIYFLYIFLGLFMSGISAMLMTLSAILPIIQLIGFDVIWFGVVLVILTEIGVLTPPVAANVFVITGISGKSMKDVYLGSAPFCFLMLVALVLVTAFPSIITWLPNVLMG